MTGDVATGPSSPRPTPHLLPLTCWLLAFNDDQGLLRFGHPGFSPPARLLLLLFGGGRALGCCGRLPMGHIRLLLGNAFVLAGWGKALGLFQVTQQVLCGRGRPRTGR